MLYPISLAILFTAPGIESHNSHQSQVPLICYPVNYNLTSVEAVDVLVALGPNGGYAVLKSCPLRTFSIDFSRSQLYAHAYSSLLDRLNADAVLGIAATEMRISGNIRRSTSNGTRDTIVVARIIRYRL